MKRNLNVDEIALLKRALPDHYFVAVNWMNVAITNRGIISPTRSHVLTATTIHLMGGKYCSNLCVAHLSARHTFVHEAVHISQVSLLGRGSYLARIAIGAARFGARGAYDYRRQGYPRTSFAELALEAQAELVADRYAHTSATDASEHLNSNDTDIIGTERDREVALVDSTRYVRFL
jgi:hypothetical protein